MHAGGRTVFLAGIGQSDTLRVELRIGFQHSGHRPYVYRKVLKVPGEFFVHDYIRSDKLVDVGSLSLERA